MGTHPHSQGFFEAMTPEDQEKLQITKAVSELREWVSDFNRDALFADGFDEAILGVAERCSQPVLVLYDADKCIEILMREDGMTREDASEYFSFNVTGAWMGENTPLFLWRLPGAITV